MKERVVLLGLDGGEPSLLVPLLAECANLRRLATEGAWGALRSTVPPLSPPAWATLLTGVNPGKHGVYDFYHMPFASSGSYVRRLIGSGHWRAPGLWQRTGAHGLRAGFVNLPMCWPPPAVQGFFVCGLGTPPGDGVAFTHPAALGPALAGAVLEPGDGTAIGDGRAFLARAERAGADMLRVAEDLWRAETLDLFCAALTFPDRFQHYFWRELQAGEPAILRAWRTWFAAFDALLGRLLDAAGPETTVVLFSDHGFGPVDRYFHANRWLARRGWLRVGDPSRLGTPDGLLTAIDWERTRAYCVGEYGDVRLNLRGREPRGIVRPGAEAEDLLAAIAADALALDDGAPGAAVDAALPGRTLFTGPWAADGPDLVLRLRGHATLCRIDGRGTDLRDPDGPLFVPADRPEHYRGAHRATGVLALWGARVRRPAAPLAADAADLTPTVCHLLGLPLDRAFDGRVLRACLAEPLASRPDAFEDTAPPAPAGGYTPEEEARVTEQLRQLGYVE
ncbi:MAG TPA: alkaline phosphatase family protein [Candidatus Binatia bacterium]|nr:alkaline phosphatase family protein [Candidatus Binatia bacterium]